MKMDNARESLKTVRMLQHFCMTWQHNHAQTCILMPKTISFSTNKSLYYVVNISDDLMLGRWEEENGDMKNSSTVDHTKE